VTAVDGTVPRRTVRLSTASGVVAVALLVAGVLAVRIFVAAHRPLSWAAAAVVGAAVLDPVVEVLAPRIRRVPAVLLCFLVAGTAAVGLAYLVLHDMDQAVDRLAAVAPDAATAIEERDDRLGQLARDMDLTNRVDDFVDALEERFGESGGEAIRSTALTAPAYFAGAILTVFLLSYGPRIGAAAIMQLPIERRPVVRRVLGRASRRARHAGLLIILDGVVVGVLSWATCRALDLPAPAALGLVAATMAILPHVGILLGAVPVALLALGLSSGPAATAVIAVAIALQALDSLVVRPRIDRYVHVGLLTPVVFLVLAHAVYGVGAAVFGFAYVVFAIAVLDELVQEIAEEGTGAPEGPGSAGSPAPADG
jgi:predicted PurR-regulated permease PerM